MNHISSKLLITVIAPRGFLDTYFLLAVSLGGDKAGGAAGREKKVHSLSVILC